MRLQELLPAADGVQALVSLCVPQFSHTERSVFNITEVLVCIGLQLNHCLDNYTCFVARLKKTTLHVFLPLKDVLQMVILLLFMMVILCYWRCSLANTRSLWLRRFTLMHHYVDDTALIPLLVTPLSVLLLYSWLPGTLPCGLPRLRRYFGVNAGSNSRQLHPLSRRRVSILSGTPAAVIRLILY
jgi:hypothetical protein